MITQEDDFLEKVVNWVQLIGINLDRDPEQI